MAWNKDVIEKVWQHGRAVTEADPVTWRQDACGAWMRWEHFGSEHCEFGWKIESIVAGVTDADTSLRPFHWRNRFDVSSNRPHCQVTADRASVAAGELASPPRNRDV
jgi:hypothetical protein